MSKGGALYSEVSVEQVKHVWGVSWDPVRGPLVDKKNCSGKISVVARNENLGLRESPDISTVNHKE